MSDAQRIYKLEGDAAVLPADCNQARGIAEYAIDFVTGKIGKPDASVLKRTEQFHTDSVICGLSALALGTNAPTVLRAEALEDYAIAGKKSGAFTFGSMQEVHPEKAIVSNSSAVREWDSNGTNFGFDPERNHTAGEFGHNDFYPVAVAACQMKGLDGATLVRAMLAIDEIRGRLAAVFSLKSYKIDHVVHGAIGSAAVYGALMGATAEQIEHAIGMSVAHYIPYRAIRAGKQLSDSKGASAAISTEAAIMSVQRAMRGFIGPKDIFRNPESVFRWNEKTEGDRSPFDLYLSHSGKDFSVMGMHFKLGLYEHQSAGAHQGLIDLLDKHPELLESPDKIAGISIVAYEPAFGIIGDPAKRDPHTRQSADHSMVYIIATLLRKAIEGKTSDWKTLMLSPYDYDKAAIFNTTTRALMEKFSFAHGGKEYDDRYPDGIPTSLVITTDTGEKLDSGLVMYPVGHARNTTADLNAYLDAKWKLLGGMAVEDSAALLAKLGDLPSKSAADVKELYNVAITKRDYVE